MPDQQQKPLPRAVVFVVCKKRGNNLVLSNAFFERWPDLFTWRKPMSGSVALVRVHVPSATAFAELLAAEAGVLLLPDVSLGSDDHQMRIGFGRSAFGDAIERFEVYLKQ